MADPEFLIDSNILIYVLARADSAAARRLGVQALGTVVTSAVALAEVLRGIPLDDVPAQSSARRLFEMVTPFPFDASAAQVYAALPFKRARFDRLIAAHALALDLTLVTNNERDFADMPGLRIENWTL